MLCEVEMHRYADVIIDISHDRLDRPFTYRIPDHLRDRILLGSQVLVPFGKGKEPRKGYVTGFRDRADLEEERIRDILDLVSLREGYTEESDRDFNLRLAIWMKNAYGSTMITALKTVMTSRKSGAPKKKRTIRLIADPEAAEEKLAWYRQKHQLARARLLEALLETPEIPYEMVTAKLHVTGPVIRALKSAGLVEIEETGFLRNPVSIQDAGRGPAALSPGQQEIADHVVSAFEAGDPGVTLIHGITGSGKTEVYINIISRICSQGRQAIMLIPEIALTYQTLIRFYRHFGDRVSVINSSLSESEKADQWERARRGEIDVIIGPRSALFTPFEKLGVIVIDEEHENSYKNESMPKYHARETAMQIARMRGAALVLGSATPSLDAYYRALTGEFKLFTLKERLTGGTLPAVEIADMRAELRRGNRSILSASLRRKLEERLQKGEQTMLFLNRRGFAGSLSCRACGYVVKCPHCDVAMSVHMGRGKGRMVCHYCGHEEAAPGLCPSCGSRYISAMKAGTEQVETYLRQAFPGARILRMDADTTSAKGSYEKILSSFANEEADILLGTQMIVKGHDFPGVTLVGILMADLSLYSNDYRAAERTFQLLTQAAGRAGRGSLAGDVVIQTYQPDHYAIVHASRQDYEGFYEEEILYRKLLLYPPVSHMLAVQILSSSEDAALSAAGGIRSLLEEIPSVLIGPAPAGIGRIRDIYRFGLYIKDPKYDTLIDYKDQIETYIHTMQGNGNFRNVQIQFDFDPVNPY